MEHDGNVVVCITAGTGEEARKVSSMLKVKEIKAKSVLNK